MITVPYKGQDWPVTDSWAEKHLADEFSALVAWETGSQADNTATDDGTLWGRLWGLLRKSDETLAERVAGHSHDDLKSIMADPELAKAITQVLTDDELRELRAVEAHIIIRRRVDHLLGRDLAEFDIQYIDHAHGQGCVKKCGCSLLAVLDDRKLAIAQAEAEAAIKEGREPDLPQFMHAHFPRKLCDEHSYLWSAVAGAGNWHNMTLSERLTRLQEIVFEDNNTEAQPVVAAAA